MIALAENAMGMPWISRWLPKLTAGVLTVLIGYTLATLTWQILAPALAPSPRPLVVADSGQTIVEDAPNYGWQIANLHLFGQASRLPQQTQALEAPETSLNLTLRGVYATGADDGLAIIASGSREEKFYHIGDEIAGGTMLKAVYADRVILERNLRLETLRLPKSEDTGVSVSGAWPHESMEPYAMETEFATEPDAPDLAGLREQMLQNPGRLGDLIQATPYQEDGQFIGYRLSPRDNPALFAQIGLQPGDIVTAINGIAIDRPDKGLLALQDLIKAEQVTVTLLRNGTEVTLQHQLSR